MSFSVHRGVALLVLTVLTAGCAHDPVSPLPAALLTDARAYVAKPVVLSGNAPPHYELRLIITFTNRSPYTVFLPRCLPDMPYPAYGVVRTSTGPRMLPTPQTGDALVGSFRGPCGSNAY